MYSEINNNPERGHQNVGYEMTNEASHEANPATAITSTITNSGEWNFHLHICLRYVKKR